MSRDTPRTVRLIGRIRSHLVSLNFIVIRPILLTIVRFSKLSIVQLGFVIYILCPASEPESLGQFIRSSARRASKRGRVEAPPTPTPPAIRDRMVYYASLDGGPRQEHRIINSVVHDFCEFLTPCVSDPDPSPASLMLPTVSQLPLVLGVAAQWN